MSCERINRGAPSLKCGSTSRRRTSRLLNRGSMSCNLASLGSMSFIRGKSSRSQSRTRGSKSLTCSFSKSLTRSSNSLWSSFMRDSNSLCRDSVSLSFPSASFNCVSNLIKGGSIPFKRGSQLSCNRSSNSLNLKSICFTCGSRSLHRDSNFSRFIVCICSRSRIRGSSSLSLKLTFGSMLPIDRCLRRGSSSRKRNSISFISFRDISTLFIRGSSLSTCFSRCRVLCPASLNSLIAGSSSRSLESKSSSHIRNFAATSSVQRLASWRTSESRLESILFACDERRWESFSESRDSVKLLTSDCICSHLLSASKRSLSNLVTRFATASPLL
mmetsp:Transcript_75258/g.118619  ORF Transcript_75258/g.118619 Transcript_75258/m.118619 type:complete len:330 (-) Transcript_75258:5-994(-)